MSEAIGGDPVTRIPSAEQLARDHSGTPFLYDFFYRWNSQPTHGTLIGAGTFHVDARFEWNRVSGDDSEWVEAEFWGMPFAACWEGAAIALVKYRDLLVPAAQLASLDRKQEFIRSMRQVPANYQAREAERDRRSG